MILLRSTKQKIAINQVLCKLCNYVVKASKKADKQTFCHCGKVGVSGGFSFLERSFPDDLTPSEAFSEMTEFETES